MSDMIDIGEIVRGYRDPAVSKLEKMGAEKISGATYTALNRTPSECLLRACQDRIGFTAGSDDQGNAKHAQLDGNWDALCVAHGELLMATAAEMAGHKPKLDKRLISTDTGQHLRSFVLSGVNAKLVNINGSPDIRRVLIAHTCSPGDWIGLLADIGRGARYANVSGADMEVLFAGVSWMLNNRSLSQFVNPNWCGRQVEADLEFNVGSRERLYKVLGIKPNRRDIPAYDTQGEISAASLQKCAYHFPELARLIFRIQPGGRLSREQVRLIASRSLENPGVSEAIRLLNDAGVISGQGGTADLEMMREFATHRGSFEPDVIMYTLAQVLAQEPEYTDGQTFKSAVCSEEWFDLAFNPYYDRIQQLGNHRTGPPPPFKPVKTAYHDQYWYGDNWGLGYNVGSGKALQNRKEGESFTDVLARMCPLEGEIRAEDIVRDLSRTQVLPVDRLLADLASFLLRAQKWAPAAVKDASDDMEISGGVSQIFQGIGAGRHWYLESQLQTASGSQVRDVYLSWLNSIQFGGCSYGPLQPWFLAHYRWSPEHLSGLSMIIMVARRFYQLVTERNWMHRRRTATISAPIPTAEGNGADHDNPRAVAADMVTGRLTPQGTVGVAGNGELAASLTDGDGDGEPVTAAE